MVAGVRYEGRPDIISRYANGGDSAFLVRDRDNKFSRNAVEVRLENGMQIGFVPEEDAVEVAAHLDAGRPHVAYIKKILTGGRSPIPVVVASIYGPDAARSDLVFEHQIPPKTEPLHKTPSASRAPSTPESTGSRSAVVVMLFIAAALGVMLLVYSMLR
jgi:HIRAN domain